MSEEHVTLGTLEQNIEDLVEDAWNNHGMREEHAKSDPAWEQRIHSIVESVVPVHIPTLVDVGLSAQWILTTAPEIQSDPRESTAVKLITAHLNWHLSEHAYSEVHKKQEDDEWDEFQEHLDAQDEETDG